MEPVAAEPLRCLGAFLPIVAGVRAPQPGAPLLGCSRAGRALRCLVPAVVGSGGLAGIGRGAGSGQVGPGADAEAGGVRVSLRVSRCPEGRAWLGSCSRTAVGVGRRDLTAP